MTTPQLGSWEGGPEASMSAEVVELALLLPSWQATALEAAARSRGLTTAQMLRRLVRDFLPGQVCGIPNGVLTPPPC
jgi:hypothetical protein